ncbi:MAG: cupredoxin domain-containing protein [Actinomycetota bacterium]
MSKKKTNTAAKNVGNVATFVETIRRSNTSRKALFVAILTGLFVLYGVYAAFATLISPTGSIADGTAIAASQVSDAISSGGGGCCGGGGGAGGEAGGTAVPSGGGGGCCGGGNQTEVKGAATVNGNIQEITVQVAGGYNPNVIEVKKGIPLKLTFERNTSGGCDSQISIPAIDVFENLPTNGKVTYNIPVPNEVGQVIDFTCGMNMLSGQIRVID